MRTNSSPRVKCVGVFLVMAVARGIAFSSCDLGPNLIVPERFIVKLEPRSVSGNKKESLSYSWVQIFGPEVTIDKPHSLVASVTAPKLSSNEPLLLGFSFHADAGHRDVCGERTWVMVEHVNSAPVPSAGKSIAADEFNVVSLDAGQSKDADHDPLQFVWCQTKGDRVQLSNPLNSSALFTMPQMSIDRRGVVATFQVWVSDGYSDWTPADVNVSYTAFHQFSKSKSDEPPQSLADQQNDRAYSDNIEKGVSKAVDQEMLSLREAVAGKNLALARAKLEKILVMNPKYVNAVQMFIAADREAFKKVLSILQGGKDLFQRRDYLNSVREFHRVRESGSLAVVAQVYINACLEALEMEARETGDSNTDAKTVVVQLTRNEEISRDLYREGLLYYSKGELNLATAKWREALHLNRNNSLALSAYNHVLAETGAK